ncbi:hypothetical protein V8F06_012859 [Rhypophila decipiens]
MARRWADEPFALIPIDSIKSDSPVTLWMARQMGSSHNNILRVLNSMYNQAPYVKKEDDMRDLLQLTLFWIDWIDNLHRAEETILFPLIGEVTGGPNIMEADIQQHEAFQPGFDKLQEYAAACLDPSESEVSFNAEQYVKLVDAFVYEFRQHLVDEVASFAAIDVAGDEATERALKKAYVDFDAQMRAESDKNKILPMVLGSSDTEFEGGAHFWPEVPAWARYMVHHYFERRHRNVWRLLPSDMWGRHRELAFGPSR